MKECIIKLAVFIIIVLSLSVMNASHAYSQKLLALFAGSQNHKLSEEAKILDSKIQELYKSGKYEEAIPYAQQSVTLHETISGKEHPDVAKSLNTLAGLYSITGKYEEAEPLFKRALEIRKKVPGKKHPDVAESLNDLADLYAVTGRYEEAETLYKQALEIRMQAFGKEHPDVASTLNNLAQLYNSESKYTEAEPLLQQALEIRMQAFGKEHPDVANTLNNLAQLYHATGKYSEAESLYKRSLEIRIQAFGKDHPNVSESMNNLAALYRAMGRYAEAEPLYKQSMKIDKKTFGKDHPNVAVSMTNLAALYRDTGRYTEAEPLYKKALEIDEKAFGKDHPDVATDMNNLAVLYRDTGRYAEAEPLHKKALEIDEKVLGKNHPDVATDMNNLAVLYRDTGRYEEAEPLFKRALELYEKAFGKEHPRAAQVMNNLVKLYHTTGRDTEAEPLCSMALEIDEKVLGKDHPNVAIGLNNLALIYQVAGRYKDAEPLFKQSLEIREKAYGNEHPRVAESLNNLARLYASMNMHAKSHDLFVQGMHIEDKIREDVFSLFSEKQKFSYIEQKQRTLYEFINHTSRYMENDSGAISNALNTWLRWKGTVMEAQGRYLDAVTFSRDPIIKLKFDELRKLRMQLAKLQLVKPEKLSFEDYKNLLKDLAIKKDALEADLSQLSKEFAFEKKAGKADIATILKILPTESAYIDFAKINLYDFQKQKWGKEHYFAFLMIPAIKDKPIIKLLDIADADELDSHIHAYLKEIKKVVLLGKPGKEVLLKKEANELYSLLLKPLETYIGSKKQLFISPDGNLHLVPFEVLIDGQRKYLIEKYQINYISAGRDIVRFEDNTSAEGDVILMGDPDYDLGLDENSQGTHAWQIKSETLTATPSMNASGMKFLRLPETKQEVDAIEKIITEKFHLHVQNYQNKQALEEILFKIEAPRILHLATHGYFLKDEEVEEKQIKLLQDSDIKSAIDLGIENPMVRSAIVLAGANASLKEGKDDGIVSAEKVLGLKLKGTNLVVLSACETGLGDIKNGEGVFGLKRAFILAGAKTIVMSLWNVSSEETTKLMIDFYELMSHGKSKAEALRQAKLSMLIKKPNPFYWAAFVMTGNPN